jgi:hypothetical protein
MLIGMSQGTPATVAPVGRQWPQAIAQQRGALDGFRPTPGNREKDEPPSKPASRSLSAFRREHSSGQSAAEPLAPGTPAAALVRSFPCLSSSPQDCPRAASGPRSLPGLPCLRTAVMRGSVYT